MWYLIIGIPVYLLYKEGIFSRAGTKKTDNAKDILARRFAMGEIDAQEYYQKMEVLEKD